MPAKKNNNQELTIKLNYLHLVWALLALNVLMLFLWSPWNSSISDARTISVSGEATVEAEPDEFQFSPHWQLDADTKEAALEEATEKADEVVGGLREAGVEDKDIKLNSNSYDNWWYDDDKNTHHTSVNINVKVDDKDKAQEIQDYLLTTNPEGQITPWPTFSDELSKELEADARELAVADAKAKAEQSASELGVKLGKVISVNEGYWGGDIFYATADTAVAEIAVEETRGSFEILPGENELSMSVTVVYEIK